MKHRLPVIHSLSTQIILSFVALALLMALAAGLPAAWLIRTQLERQMWAQIEQGHRAAQALYAAEQDKLTNLATLTAQRPTLHELLTTGDQEALLSYLAILQQGSGLDLLLLCDAGRVLAQAGPALSEVCTSSSPHGFHIASGALGTGQGDQIWLLASQPLKQEGLRATIVVGQVLDDDFARQMREHTGLEHSLLIDGQPAASTLATWRTVVSTLPDGARAVEFLVAGEPYYADRFTLSPFGVEAEVAVAASGFLTTQRQLVGTLVGVILIMAAVASVLGAFLARRISGPLDHLAHAAEAMRKANLDEPLALNARVREVSIVAEALESARSDLKRSLAELRQEKAWVDHLLEAIVEGIVTLDRRGRITFFSAGAERITGWQRAEVVGQSCDQVFKPAESVRPFSELIPPPGGRKKISVSFPDRRQVVLAVTGAQLLPPEGVDARVALVFRDISDEEVMHRLLAHFLANIAHEFRTPLSALAASVELLLDLAPRLSSQEIGELLISLHLGVLGLQTLIDNLLESASIEAGHFRITPRPCNLADVLADAIATMQPLLDKHDQRLVVELPAAIPIVRADPKRTAQVLVNLLSNASKYGPDDTEIDLVTMIQADWVRVSVADRGPGVPLDQRHGLFRRFVHPAPHDGQAQVGVGLGLSVVKAIVEAHGGQVGIDDRSGGGSVFWFTLPIVEGEP